MNKGSTGPSQFIAPIVVFPAAVAAGVAVPVFTAVQEKGKAQKSLANAKQIAVACKIYAADHDGAFPAELKALVPEYLPDGTTLISPFNHATVGYKYTTSLTDTAPPDSVLLEDLFAPKEGFKIIVRVDGSGEIQKIKK